VHAEHLERLVGGQVQGEHQHALGLLDGGTVLGDAGDGRVDLDALVGRDDRVQINDVPGQLHDHFVVIEAAAAGD
jgi:hypothetical protein